MAKLDDINKSLGDLEQELDRLKSASEMIEGVTRTAEQAAAESARLNQTADELCHTVGNLTDKIDRIDFHSRLDKLDATVSGINVAIQNIQGRFDTLERNIKDDFEHRISALRESLGKSHLLNLILLIVISLLACGVLIITLVK
ncbi:hypothetical protein FJZ31_43590 [Candidatus Poribacteria bacterium]|nr:hypothetical protein [Candidatus Poribacteria bacterium]